MPGDHQSRKLRDPLAPRALDPVCVAVCERLAQHPLLTPLRVLDAQLFVALEGTNSFSSTTMHGHHCLTRQLTNGHTLSSHAALTPVIVCPGQPQVIALPPESIMPQDGQAKQDCERAAGTRWLTKQAKQVAPQGVTFLGDDLYSNQPFCAVVLQHQYNCIFTCKPDSHPKLSERVAFWQATDGIAEHEARCWHGRLTAVTRYRYINDVLLRDGADAWAVHWLEITVVQGNTGQQLSHKSWITNHRVSAATVAAVAHAGRGRWKIANEHNNVLKTKGYHLAHNCGHGTQYLSAFLLSLNLLAFLFHTVWEWSDDKDALRRRVLARRQTFFDDGRALTRYRVFDHWDHLMEFMIRGLALEAQCDSS